MVELEDAVQVRRRGGIFLDPNVGSDATFLKPLAPNDAEGP
jgi:hypothetical protein